MHTALKGWLYKRNTSRHLSIYLSKKKKRRQKALKKYLRKEKGKKGYIDL